MRMMKRILFALMASLLALTALFVPVSAESTETISSVDIDAVLNTDGTVSVTETWTVDYLGASDGFTRNLDLYTGSSDGMTLLQKYDEIKDVSVAIDGKPAPESATEMNAYIFQKSDDGSCYMIAVNSPSAQVTKTYTIGYTITGALKKKSGDANFSFMFIGDTLPYTCNNVTITVTPPEGIEADKISVPENSRGVVNEDNVVFAIKYVTKTFAAEMTMPDSVFEDGALVSYSAAKANLKAFGNSLLRVLPWILAVIAVIALAAFVLFGDRIRRAKLEKEAANLNADTLPDTLPTEYSPCETYKILVPYSRIRPKATSKKIPYLFGLALLECIEKGYIVSDGVDFLVGTPTVEVPAYLHSVLNFVKTFCTQKNGQYVIDKDFGKRVQAECASHYDLITNYLISFYDLIPAADGKFFKNEQNRDFYEKAYRVKDKAAKSKSKTAYADMVRKVLGGAKTESPEIFAMMFSALSADKFFAYGVEESVSAIAEAISGMYSVFVKSK